MRQSTRLTSNQDPLCNGFSLIELLITVSIILILSALSIPSLLRAKMSANEAAAGGSLRTIITAEVAYSIFYPQLGYTTLPNLGSTPTGCNAPASTRACLIDSALTTGTKSGYSFVITLQGSAPVRTYAATATPVKPKVTGIRNFCSDQTGVMRYSYYPTACDSTSTAGDCGAGDGGGGEGGGGGNGGGEGGGNGGGA